MMVNKVELCGVNTSKLPLLKEDEKEKLFERIQAGDKNGEIFYLCRADDHWRDPALLKG